FSHAAKQLGAILADAVMHDAAPRGDDDLLRLFTGAGTVPQLSEGPTTRQAALDELSFLLPQWKCPWRRPASSRIT
ncbi:hypothetical protein, partial [Streptomyces flaveolus]|uniref:hypothetical protein n=1 Tax=Streptomyces flaveolus TaxID=67297 RepID=UPI0034028B3A